MFSVIIHLSPVEAIVIAIVFVVLGAWKPLLASTCLVIGAPLYLIRGSVFGIPTTLLEVALIGTVAGWLLRVVYDAVSNREPIAERWQRFKANMPTSLMIWGVIAVLGWCIATAVSIDRHASLGALKSWLLEPAAIGLLLLIECRSDRDRRMVLYGLLAALFWVSIAGFAQLVWFRSTVEDNRLSSIFAPVANYFAMFAGPLIVLAAGLAILRRMQWFAMTAAGIGLVGMLFSFSYGGLIAVAAGFLVLLVTVVPQKIRKRTFWILVCSGVLLVAAQLPGAHLKEKLNFSTRSSSLVRTQIWRTAVEIGKDHPLLGIGPNTFEQAYRETVPKLYYPPLEWLVAKPHNLYLNLWVETGILGLLGTMVFLGHWLRRMLKNDEDRPFTAVLAASIVALLAHGFVDTPLFKNDLALIAAVVLALGLVASTKPRTN